MQLYDCAINYLNAGLAVLPADKKQKRPLLSGWKQFQRSLPLESLVRYWFNKELDALCLICGNVWDVMFPVERYKFIRSVVESITAYTNRVEIEYKTDGLESIINETETANGTND